ncbi:MAG TPA: transporter substrate-binding domain-containing protein [Paucimonas sp.]|nr:transporter substrate-binding domain-containing protein [Paucimonas sp.]
MRLRFVLLLMAMSIIVPACGSAAAGELLIVGAHFARVFERTTSGEYVGLGPDIMRAVAQRTGDRVRFEIYPWARAQALVEQGLADVLVGPYKTAEREARFAFAARPFYQDEMVFYVRSADHPAWDGNYALLRTNRVAAVNGWVYGSAFDRAREELRVGNAGTLENGLLMLVYERIDLFATNRRNTEAAIDVLQMRGAVKPITPIIDTQQGYFAFPKRSSHDELRQRFNRAFNDMIDKGELASLARKHGVIIP